MTQDNEHYAYTMPLHDGRMVLVLVPMQHVRKDRSWEIAFTPDGVRLLDRVRALAAALPETPTPGMIRTLREALGMTQAALGEKIGVDKLTVSRWERGTMTPSAGAVKKLDALRRKLGRRGVV
ncbi:MAG: XRE family transcriptional regulator [Phycisphaeraceae bacterium]|nr:MAG: XRE family transcriptional regulator [Phycisphaeraceae bacterium]